MDQGKDSSNTREVVEAVFEQLGWRAERVHHSSDLKHLVYLVGPRSDPLIDSPTRTAGALWPYLAHRLELDFVLNTVTASAPRMGEDQSAAIKQQFLAHFKFEDTRIPVDRESTYRERNERIKELWSKGKTDAQIGLDAKVNLSDDRVKQIRRELGLIEESRKRKRKTT